jgi:thioredoxin-like negative regulator of GroEL
MAKRKTFKITHLLAASPAVLALGGGLLLGLTSHASKPLELEWCQTAATTAEDNADYKTVSVCYARLLQAQPHNQEIAFNLAQALQATGQAESAQSLMVKLASADSGGYLPAQLWLAQQVLTQANPSSKSIDAAAARLTAAAKTAPDNQDINYWLAVANARQDKWDAVETPAAKVKERYEELTQLLCKIAAAQGNSIAARRWNHAG